MKLYSLSTILCSTLFATSFTQANDNFSLRIEGGLTGYGGALFYQVNPSVSLALGYNGGKINWRDNVKISNASYDLDMNNKTTYFNALLYPWAHSEKKWINTTYVAVGVGYLGDNYDVDHTYENSSKLPKKARHFFTKDEPIHVAGNLNYNHSIAPYLGLGISPKIAQNWQLFGELGTYYTGNVELDITQINQVNLSEYESSFKLNDQTYYKWHPVAKIGVIYQF